MNQLLSAQAVPSVIKDKGTTKIEVTCTVDDDGDMSIEPTDGFLVSKTSEPLAKHQTSAKFNVVITRTTAPKVVTNCDLTLEFMGSTQTTTVTVT